MTQDNSQFETTEATEEQKIVVLDDDRLSAHNISIQLRFVGETPLFSTSDNWKPFFELLSESQDLDKIFAIALGVIKSCPLIDLLNALHNQFPKMPLLLLNNQEEIQYSQLPESLLAKFIPLGDQSLNYRSLLVALQNARQLSGRKHSPRPSSIISETGTAMFRSLAGQSERMQRVRQLVLGVATRQVSALVIGESGTGKEIVARNLHYHSGRAEKPFIVVNCSAMAPDRNGVELFGQEKNAQGALESVPGLIEKAHGGTLFFDDVAELPLNVQGMLLRFLEDKKFQRMGGHATITIDVRVVAATRYNLEDKMRQGNFRQDLYYRLSVVPIEIPPLRDRVEDIPDLIKELLSRLENKEHSSIRFNSAALQSLQQHSWPGNVRELANLVERMCIIKPNEVIGMSDLPQEYQYADKGKRIQEERQIPSGKIVGQTAPAPDLVSHVPTPATGPGQVVVPVMPETSPIPAEQSREDTPAPAVAETPATEKIPRPIPTESQQPVDKAPAGIQPEPKRESAATENTGVAPRQGEFASAAMLPLNAERLEQYLHNLERNMLEVAMQDSANIKKFAADRLKLDENSLREKLEKHGLTA